VTSTTSDPDPGDNTGTDSDNATPSADLSLVKTLTTAGPYAVGQSVNFDIVVSNAGPSTATSVAVTDTPNNLTITNVAGAGCAALPCVVPSVASGTSVTITVTATINADGVFGNTASVTSDTSDPDPSDNTDTDTDSTLPGANLSVVKSLTTAGPYSLGQTVTFDIVVANAGPSTATNIQVSDTPTNLTLTGVSGACAALPCTIASLASGASTTITVTATIVADGPFGNTATVSSEVSDPDPSDNTDTDTGSTTPSADLSLVKTLTTAGPYSVGQSVSFSIVVSNAGPSTANGVQVADTPSNLTITAVSGAGCAALPCTLASLGSGATATVNVTATINAEGAFGNTATVTSTTTDPDPGDNTGTDTGSTTPSADLSILKTVNTPSPTIGSTVTFTLALANAGPSTALAVQVADLLPAGYTFVSATPSVGSYNSGAGVWTVGTLASGGNATLTLQATVNATGPYANTATVSSTTPDPDPSDNSSTSTPTPINPIGNADLAVLKTGPAQIERGQQVTFTIRVENRGPDTAINARLQDPTPAGLTFVSTAGACTGPFPCMLGNMASGEVRMLTATYFVPADYAGPNMIVNVVTAVSDSADPTPGDSSSSSSVLVPQGQPNFASPQVVPVDARWAMLLLAGVMLLLAGRRLPRRD
jgi:large repetitive protein